LFSRASTQPRHGSVDTPAHAIQVEVFPTPAPVMPTTTTIEASAPVKPIAAGS
jgi:hypothetical protein